MVDSDFRSPTSIINENVAKISTLVRSDRRLTIKERVDEMNLSFHGI